MIASPHELEDFAPRGPDKEIDEALASLNNERMIKQDRFFEIPAAGRALAPARLSWWRPETFAAARWRGW
jgi:hypothetical protein